MLDKIKVIIRKRIFRSIENFEIDIEKLHELQKNGAKVVDVRSPLEYNEGHLDGAINIPGYEINPNIIEILPNTSTIILYCRSGHRSKKAYKKLKQYAYSDVYSLYGGIENL